MRYLWILVEQIVRYCCCWFLLSVTWGSWESERTNELCCPANSPATSLRKCQFGISLIERGILPHSPAQHALYMYSVCVYARVCVCQAGKNKKVTRIERDAAMPNLITCRVCLQCFFSLQWIHHTSVLRYFCLNVMFSYFLHTSPLKCIKALVSRSSRCQTQCGSSLQFKYINYFKVCRVSDTTL